MAQALLSTRDVTGLLADYSYRPDGADLRLVPGALRLSAHMLDREPAQLATQLVGRLLSQPSSALKEFLQRLGQHPSGPWLRPLRESLAPAGGPLVRTLAGHTVGVRAVAVTPDGRCAVSASDDETLKVWDLASGQQRLTLAGHGDWVLAVAVTPDGRCAVSASDDGTLKVWDLDTGAMIATFVGDGGFLTCAVARDGKTIVAGDQLGQVHFLRLEGV
jgi:WD40 repeat protein